MDSPVSDRITLMCDKCFFFLSSSASLCWFPLQIICSQRHRTAPVSAESAGNWVQKWHLAFRSDRLGAICSVFAKGGTVDVLGTDEENWKHSLKHSRGPRWTNEESSQKVHKGNEERFEDVRVGLRASQCVCLFVFQPGSLWISQEPLNKDKCFHVSGFSRLRI